MNNSEYIDRVLWHWRGFVCDTVAWASAAPPAPLPSPPAEQNGHGDNGVIEMPKHNPGFVLTKREAEVMNLVSSGMKNGAVARALFVEQATVKFHLSSIFRKLAVDNRTQAVAVWLAKNPTTAATAEPPAERPKLDDRLERHLIKRRDQEDTNR